MKNPAPLVDMMSFMVLFALILYIFADNDFDMQDEGKKIFSIEIKAINKPDNFLSFYHGNAEKSTLLLQFYAENNNNIILTSKLLYNFILSSDPYPKKAYATFTQNLPFSTIYLINQEISDKSILLQPIKIKITITLGSQYYDCSEVFIPGQHAAIMLHFNNASSITCKSL